MQPDVSEFWPTPIHRIPFEITKEQFEAMKLAIETDKRDDNQIFQLVGKNCTQYVESIAKIGNIEIPTAKPFWQLLCQRYGHPNIQTGVKVTEAILPSTISSIFSTTCTFICNLSLQLAGANKIDPNICQENQKCSPHLGTLGDLFNPTKLLVHHPFTVGHETESLVLNWQAKQILELCKNPHFRKINPEKRELLMIKARFSCPPKQK
jgi:hypothetical protein